MRYAVVIEKAVDNYSAYVPDLPGCVATGETVAEVERELREAIRFHIEGLKEDGLPVPPPTAVAEYVDAWALRKLKHPNRSRKLRSFLDN
jgi:predicted RNase H-like HicB family nuclease